MRLDSGGIGNAPTHGRSDRELVVDFVYGRGWFQTHEAGLRRGQRPFGQTLKRPYAAAQ